MSKILIGICIIVSAFFSISLATGQPFSFQTQTNKSTTTNSARTALTPEQFRTKVHTQSQKNRRELSESAKKNAKPISINVTPSSRTPTLPPSTQTNYTPGSQTLDENYYTQKPTPEVTEQKPMTPTPVQPKPPTTTTTSPSTSSGQNTEVYTGFSSGSGGGTSKPSNTGSSGGGWNINY